MIRPEPGSADIAVVGMACRLPGGVRSVSQLSSFLRERRCGVAKIPADRFDIDAFCDADGRNGGMPLSRWAGLVDDLFAFDPAFFEISNAEALQMDPQQRLLLMTAYEAAADAGLRLADLERARTGVFVGISSGDAGNLARMGTASEGFAGTGSTFSIAANRVSHRFNLSGPSYAVDTACSSALVAIDQACLNLREGRCDIALAGGVNALLEPSAFIAFSAAGMLSPTGRISAFDEGANGFVRGEGCGLVVLKRLDRALSDGDQIHAVVRATLLNQDGRTGTLTAPNEAAQRSMLEGLCEQAAVSARGIGYVEAHGTGTPVGDPIEAHAIGRVLGGDWRETPLPIGSIKPNIGHLESAAGAAGFIKAVVTVRDGIVFPNIHFDSPNPAIPFDALGLRVPLREEPLPRENGLGHAVVNSFGYGGTNASALVSYFDRSHSTAISVAGWTPPHQAKAIADQVVGAQLAPVLVPVSAPSVDGLERFATSLADHVETEGISPAEVAKSLWERRDLYAERAVLVAPAGGGPKVLAEGLRRIAGNRDASAAIGDGPTIVRGRARAASPVVFCYSGQGAQWWAMGRNLFETSAAYRREVERFDAAFRAHAGWSVIDELLKSETQSRIHESAITQPALVALQLGLTAFWQARGIEPDLVLGHSLGEIPAAVAARAITVETAARLIDRRRRIGARADERGAMAAVGLLAAQAAQFLPDDESVTISAYNAPGIVTLSGRVSALETALDAIRQAYPGTLIRQLQTDFAWHSLLLDDEEAEFRVGVNDLPIGCPEIAFLSSVTAKPVERLDQDYWWSNLRRPVDYEGTVAAAIESGARTFLEIGPQSILTPLNRRIADEAGESVSALASLSKTLPDLVCTASATAGLIVAGHVVRSEAILPADTKASTLPPYPFSATTYRQMPPEARHMLYTPSTHPLLGRRTFGPDYDWTSSLDLQQFPQLADHGFAGEVFFPAAGFLQIMAAACREVDGEGPVDLTDVVIVEGLPIRRESKILLRTTYDATSRRIQIHARDRDGEEGWRLCVRGKGLVRRVALAALELERSDVAAGQRFDADTFYGLVTTVGYHYGDAFRLLKAAKISDREPSWARVEGEVDDGEIAQVRLLDAPLQLPIALAALREGLWRAGPDGPEILPQAATFGTFVPVEIDRVVLSEDLPSTFEMILGTFDNRENCVIASHADGQPFLRIENIRARVVPARNTDNATQLTALVERFVSREPEAAGPEDRPLPFVVVSERSPWVNSLCGSLDWEPIVSPAEPDMESRVVAYARMLELHPRSHCVFVAADGAADQLAAVGMVEDAIALARAIGSLPNARRPIQLTILTYRARSIESDVPPLSLAAAGLPGLSRTLGNELENVKVRAVDIDEDTLSDPATLRACFDDDGPETEWVVRGASAFVPRLERADVDRLARRPLPRSIIALDENVEIAIGERGRLSSLHLRACGKPDLGPDDVCVKVAAAGLNFRDVMAGTGLLPDDGEGPGAWWRNLGLECAGTVESVGSSVRDFAPGDRVMGIGKGLFRRYAVVPAAMLARVPDGMDLVDAAAVPIAFLTAQIGLEDFGGLAEGDAALVHLTSGGVGLAALQVAAARGATVYGSAGNDDKRAIALAAGASHVFDSRSHEFVDQVVAVTGGKGVDVVLNALTGDAIDLGLQCLAPYGRFVEIGKRDLAADRPLSMRRLYHGQSVHVLDLAEFAHLKPQAFGRAMTIMAQRFEQGVYRPLPSERVPARDVADAFARMGQGRHIGKIVITMDDEDAPLLPAPAKPLALRQDATYLVTGGTRGFGLTVAAHLAGRGARHLVLASRTGEVDAVHKTTLESMRAGGCDVTCTALDLTDDTAVQKLVDLLTAGERPLAGIVHAAAIIDDALLDQQDSARIDRVMAAKVGGLFALDRALGEKLSSLDFFVLLSSVAECFGSVGQASYAAANGILNAYAASRSAQGARTNAIAWGALGESGIVARSQALRGYLESVGILPISDADALQAFDLLLDASQPSVAFLSADKPALRRALRATGASPRLAGLLARAGGGTQRLANELSGRPRETWDAVIADAVRSEVAHVLKCDPRLIEFDRPLSDYGLDSLSSLELKNRIEALADVSLTVTAFLSTPTVAGLAKAIAALIERAEAAPKGNGVDGGEDDERDEMPSILPRQMAVGPEEPPLQVVRSLNGGDPTRLLAAWQRLVNAHPIMALRRAEDGTLTADDEGTAGERACWRYRVIGDSGADAVLVVEMDRAAGDWRSLNLVATYLVAATEGADRPVPSTPWEELARTLPPYSQEGDACRSVAYVREMLARRAGYRPVTPSIEFAFGRPAAGATFRLNFSIRLGPKTGKRPVEAFLAAAMARAILVSGMDSRDPVILLHDLAGKANEEVDVIGPLAAPAPLFLDSEEVTGDAALDHAERRLAQAERHRAFDIAAIRATLPELSAQLTDFGLAMLSDDPLLEQLREVALRDMMATKTRLGILAEGKRSGRSIRVAMMAHRPETAVARAFVRALEDFGIVSDIEGSLDAWRQEGSVPTNAPTRDRANRPQGTSTTSTLFPLTQQQRFLVPALASKSSSESFREFWQVERCFRVRPGIDGRRLAEAVSALAARHEALRMRFVETRQGWRARVDAAAEPTVATHDWRGLDPASVEDALAALRSRPIDLFEGYPWRIALARVDDGVIISASAHQAILDGWSMAILVDELLRLYLHQSLPDLLLDHAGYLARFDRGDDETRIGAQRRWLEQTFANLPPVPAVGRAAKGLAPNVDMTDSGPAGEFVARLRQSDRLPAGSLRNGRLIAALAGTLASRGGTDDVVVAVPHAARASAALQGYAGWVATIVPVVVRSAATADIADTTSAVEAQLASAADLLPADGLTRHGAFHRHANDSGSYLTLFEAGMLAVDRGGSSPLQLGLSGGFRRIDLGVVSVDFLPGQSMRRGTAYEFDMRSFQDVDGLAFRCGYDTLAFDAAEAESIARKTLDRLGVGRVTFSHSHASDLRLAGE